MFFKASFLIKKDARNFFIATLFYPKFSNILYIHIFDQIQAYIAKIGNSRPQVPLIFIPPINLLARSYSFDNEYLSNVTTQALVFYLH